MFERELRIYAFLLGYEQKLLADLPDEAMRTPVTPQGHPPSWIVGHLAVVADFGLGMLGRPALCPKAWMVMFGPGSKPAEHLNRHPPKAELVAALERGHEHFSAAAKDADPAKLAGPSPFEPLRHALPTAGDLLAHLLTSHEAGHVAQLSACRRGRGLPPLF
jgi:DinB superfamily